MVESRGSVKSLPHFQDIIVKAIMDKQKLEIVYHGETRIIEPHAIGITTKGNSAVRAYQVEGGAVFGKASEWKMFKLCDIESINGSGFFKAPRPDYQKGDKGLSTILIEL
jgi:hypothetical protein